MHLPHAGLIYMTEIHPKYTTQNTAEILCLEEEKKAVANVILKPHSCELVWCHFTSVGNILMNTCDKYH